LRIQSFRQANELNTRLIRELESMVNSHDQIAGNCSLDFSLNVDQSMDCLFMAFEDQHLVGVMTFFMPDLHEVEISAFTHPNHRLQGVFKGLLHQACLALSNHTPIDLLFVCNSLSKAGIAMMKSIGATYDFSEYALTYQGSNPITTNTVHSSLLLRRAEPKDLNALAEIRSSIFDEPWESALSRVAQALSLSHRTQWVAVLNDEIIGIATSSIEELTTYIVGFGILPKVQGMGYGKAFLLQLMAQLMRQDHLHLTLDVDSMNAKAFKLYQSCGFKVSTALDYYRYHLTKTDMRG